MGLEIVAILDSVAAQVGFFGERAVALHVDIQMDLDDLVGGEKTIADALLQGVAVNRLAEIMDIGDVLVSLSVAVRPIWEARSKYSRISRQAESSAALPRWHSSMTMRSKKPRENSRKSFWRSSGPVMAW